MTEKKKNFDKAIRILEFDKVREMLAQSCPTEGARALALALTPSRSAQIVRRMLTETTDAKNMQTVKGMPPFYGVRDVTDCVDRADKGSVLTPGEILSVRSVFSAARALSDYANTAHSDPTSLDEYFGRLEPNRRLEDKIEKCIRSEDSLNDTASDKLYDIRRKMMRANARIRDDLQKFVTGSAYAKCLQEQIVTMRDGRYVIPVKAECRNEIKGLVHDTSSSGATLFIEPLSVVESNNELRLLEKQEHDEIERILSELSADIADNSDAILANYRHITLLAFIFAKGSFSFKLDATAPEITDERRVNLLRARHPLLNKDTVVPITVSVGHGYDTLIITGPNTGGKTVTLKTLGLFALMTQAGMHIPVSDGSSLCVFDDILADIGDEQSIEQSLSTFSAHMVNIVDITENADSHSLVLFDELGAGTDPVEGAALAVSILESVRERRVLCAATTHYAELKSFAIETDGVMNASCEFDVATLRPTYKLVIGAPGKSNAFAISEKLGLDPGIIGRAQTYVSGENRRFENVIEQLEAQRVEMEKLREEAERTLDEARRTKAQSDAAIEQREERSRKELEKAQATAVSMVEGAKASSEFIFAELEKAKKAKESERLAEKLDDARHAIKMRLKADSDILDPIEEHVIENYVLPRPLKKGDEVVVISLNRRGVVTDTDGKNITVLAGNMSLRTKPDGLMLIDGINVTCRDRSEKKKITTGDRQITAFSPEIDLRGQYGEDGCFMLDKFIDGAIRAGLHEIRVIHGKGTGALRKAVTAFLRSDKRISSIRIGNIGEGDTGVTIAELKQK
ncbi:MAG: endonuclease MutS2 [Clostridia bacterium]|nr:endonuclease MutS2 [Clostridia bacterium]